MIFHTNKQEKNYQHVCWLLEEAGITTLEQAQHCKKASLKRSFFWIGIILLIGGIIYIVLPSYQFYWGILLLFALSWVILSTLTTNKMIRRYIREQLSSGAMEARK